MVRSGRAAAHPARQSRRLRTEVEPARRARSARFLPPGTRHDRARGPERLRDALVPLQALSLPVALWEPEVLPRRVPGYRPAQLDQLLRLGRGRLGRAPASSRVALYFREDAPLSAASGAAEPPRGRARRRPARAARRGALFWFDLVRDDRARGRGAAGALGSRLGRRGDERRLAARCERQRRYAAARQARAPDGA